MARSMVMMRIHRVYIGTYHLGWGKHACTLSPVLKYTVNDVFQTTTCCRHTGKENEGNHDNSEQIHHKKTKEIVQSESLGETVDNTGSLADVASKDKKKTAWELNKITVNSEAKNTFHTKREHHQSFIRRRSLSPSQRLGNLLETNTSGQIEDVRNIKEIIAQLDKPNLQPNYENENQRYDAGTLPMNLDANGHIVKQVHCFSMGELVMLKVFHHKKNLFVSEKLWKLEKDNYKLPNHGEVTSSQIIGQPDGAIVTTSAGHDVMLVKPSLAEYIKFMKIYAWKPDPKVLCSMLSSLGIGPGDTVLEAGSGSGGSALMLSRAIFPDGQVFSIDMSYQMACGARMNVDKWVESMKVGCGQSWAAVTICNMELQLYVTSQDPKIAYDAVYLDVKNPYSLVDIVNARLKFGKSLALYCPNVTQIVRAMQVIEDHKLPLIAEGVWEESNKQWKVNGGKMRGSCQNSQITDDGPVYHSLTPVNDEESTAFLAKFIKCNRNLQEECSGAEEEDSHLYTPKLHSGEYVLLTAVVQLKKRPIRKLLVKLEHNSVTQNDWGVIKHCDIIGCTEGSILESSTGAELYIRRPSMEEFLQMMGTRGQFHPRMLNFANHELDLRPGNRVLTIENTNSGGLALTLARSVSCGGNVHVFTREESEQSQLLMTEWARNLEFQQKNAHVNNITISSVEALDLKLGNDLLYDAACIAGCDPTKYLDLVSKKVPEGRYVVVITKSLSTVLKLYDYIASQKLPLAIGSIYEDRERPWVLRPVLIQGKFEKQENVESSEGQYICRPKQKADKATGFLVTMRKVARLRRLRCIKSGYKIL